MKKTIIASLCVLGSFSAMAAPADPMENYTPSKVQDYEINRLWNEIGQIEVKGDDCYRRAHLWSYQMYRNHNIKSSKIFIHYTDKFNRELDNLGRKKGLGWFAKKTLKIEDASKRTVRMIRSNITWDYHVAPMLTLESGEKVVMDRYLDLAYDAGYPYTEKQAWDLKARPATPEEWVEALTIRGELIWEARKQEIINEVKDLKKKARKTKSEKRQRKYLGEAAELQAKFVALGMDKMDRIDIKCKKITNMAELDAAQTTEWCFWSESPMYYYNEMDLRYLTYGDELGLGYKSYQRAIPTKYATEENFENGKREYIQTRFNEKELEDAEKEIKPQRDND